MNADDGTRVDAGEPDAPTPAPPIASLERKARISPLGESMVELLPDHVRFTACHNLDAFLDVPREEVAAKIRYLAAHPAGLVTLVSFRRGSTVTLRGSTAEEQEAMLRWLAPYESRMLSRLARRTSTFAAGLVGWQVLNVLLGDQMELALFDLISLICAPIAVGLVVWAFTRPTTALFTVASLIILVGMGPDAVMLLLDGSYLFGALWALFVLTVSSAFRTPTGFFRALHRLHEQEDPPANRMGS